MVHPSVVGAQFEAIANYRFENIGKEQAGLPWQE
jgi:hypothetical protein